MLGSQKRIVEIVLVSSSICLAKMWKRKYPRPIKILKIKPVDESLRLAPIPSGTPIRANARHASEKDCLDVMA